MRNTLHTNATAVTKHARSIPRRHCSLAAAAAIFSAMTTAGSATCANALRAPDVISVGQADEPLVEDVTQLLEVKVNNTTNRSVARHNGKGKGKFLPMEGFADSAQSPKTQGVFMMPGEGAVFYDQRRGGHPGLGGRYPGLSEEKVGFGQMLVAIGGGTGAHVGASVNPEVEREIIMRMRYQDKVVMILLLLAYLGALLFSASLAYHEARNNSRVKYYADPRFHDLSMDGNQDITRGVDVREFLRVFDEPPKDVHLQVTGLLPPRRGQPAWMDQSRVAFSFALDLSSWVVREGAPLPAASLQATTEAQEGNQAEPVLSATDAQEIASRSFGPHGNALGYEFHDEEAEAAWAQHQRSLQDGDVEKLRHCLSNCANDLAVVSIQQDVAWKGWEELATNVKTKIRQAGFQGKVHVMQGTRQPVNVHKNTTWANFMHGRPAKVLFALSVLGWLIYHPYMWLRCWAVPLKSRYRVQVPIDTFWPLIEDKLNAEGFDNRTSYRAA